MADIKDDVLRFRVEKEFKEKVNKAAEIEERRVSDYLYRLVAKDLKEKGLL